MKVLLTGGAGRVGLAAVERLVKSGHDVRVVGRRPEASFEGAAYASCDITDYDALLAQMRDRDAVVHLAAIPSPSAPGPEMFRVNAQGTFNVFQAAADTGITRVVQASSINSLGSNYGIKVVPIVRLPIDEEHPLYTSDPYSFSKNVIEDIGRYFWRRCGISSVALRLPAVYHGGTAAEEGWRTRGLESKAAFERVLERSEDEVMQFARGLVTRFNSYRSRPGYGLKGTFSVRSEHGEAEPAFWRLVCYRADFWTLIDDRDSAQSIEKGLTAAYEGSHDLYVNDSHNGTNIPSADLARVFFPDVALSTGGVQGTDTLVSIDKARALIGYEPEYSLFGPRPK
jgi:nucleoside-diphosphate-sugar epimerase